MEGSFFFNFYFWLTLHLLHVKKNSLHFVKIMNGFFDPNKPNTNQKMNTLILNQQQQPLIYQPIQFQGPNGLMMNQFTNFSPPQSSLNQQEFMLNSSFGEKANWLNSSMNGDNNNNNNKNLLNNSANLNSSMNLPPELRYH